MFQKIDFKEFETVKKELENNSFYLNLNQNNLEGISLKELNEIHERDMKSNRERFDNKMNEMLKLNLDFNKYHNPGEEEAVILGKELTEKINTFCDAREKHESNFF
jgi:hypothetical protein